MSYRQLPFFISKRKSADFHKPTVSNFETGNQKRIKFEVIKVMRV